MAVMKKDIFDVQHYDFGISRELIAQEPASPRDSSRLMMLNRKSSVIKEGIFRDVVDYLQPGDLLVLNNTKVIKARLIGKRAGGGRVEVLLLKKVKEGIWEALAKPGKRAKINDIIIFEKGVQAKVIAKTEQAARILDFCFLRSSPPEADGIESFLEQSGKVPLPPYIKKEVNSPQDYQTIYAEKQGAIAAPTAGLHFTKDLINKIKNKGVEIVYVTLHCGLATFRPVKTEDIRDHKIEAERVEVSSAPAEAINKAKLAKKRIIAVGTTAIRTLESAAVDAGKGIFTIKPFYGETSLYITPGYKFKIIDAVITNFHTPASTNLILISSFCGLEPLCQCYIRAAASKFRFYSFGDAMLIV